MRSDITICSLRFLLTFVVGLSVHFKSFSQQLKSNFISVQSDNDVYLLTSQDRYYTNGLILGFEKPLSYSVRHTDLLSVELGHQLFNGSSYYIEGERFWDRPSTGRIFLNGRFQRVQQSELLWRVKTEVAVVGKAAKGKEVQTFVHELLDMYEVDSWESQLNSAFGVDLELEVMKPLWRSSANIFELAAGGAARGGMSFTNLSAQLFMRVGSLADYHSSHFVGNGGLFDAATEYYFFYSLSYKHQFYNETVQGGIFAQKRAERYDLTQKHSDASYWLRLL